MNLQPRNDPDGETLDYNWTGWEVLAANLRNWGVDISEMKGCNDGDVICAETCTKIADALDAHLHELTPERQKWLADHAAEWRRLAAAGGCEQH